VNGTDAGTVPAAAALIGNASEAGERFEPVAVFGWRSGDVPLIRVPENETNDRSNGAARGGVP
jgi:hypothetical protein